MHQREGAAARFGQYSNLGDSILEDCQLQRFRSVSPEAVSNRVSVRLSGTKVRIHALGFGFTVKTYICRANKNVILDRLRPRSGPKGAKDSHFKAFLKFSTFSRRNFSASAARDALDRATSTLAVTTFS
jgi:hypothetical protein